MLKDRLLTAIPLLAVVLLAFLLPGWPGACLFVLLCSAFLVLACREFFALSSSFAGRGYATMTWLCGLALTLAAWGTAGSTQKALLLRLHWDVIILSCFIFLCFAAACRAGMQRANLQRAFVSMVGAVYACWLPSFIPKLYFSSDADMSGKLLLLYLVAVTKMGDTGAYAVGTLTARRPGGNHKLLPAISPKKSWEGLIGGIIASLVTALLLQRWWGDSMSVLGRPALTLLDACIVGIGAALVGLVGDLAESALKRAAAAKDSGSLPGLGGVLDLLDSLIATAPLFFAYIHMAALLR